MSMLSVLAAISILVLSACSDRKEPSVKEQVRKEHIFQGQERALEKAKGVEQTLQDAATQQRGLIDRQDQ